MEDKDVNAGVAPKLIQENPLVVYPESSNDLHVGDTIYTMEPNVDPEAAQYLRKHVESGQFDLSDTSKEDRARIMSERENRNRNTNNNNNTVNIYWCKAKETAKSTARSTAKAVVRGGAETLGNFDAVLGLFSYSAMALAAAYFEQGKHREGWIFGVIGLVLVVAKHRASPGWIIDLLKRDVEASAIKRQVIKKKVDDTIK